MHTEPTNAPLKTDLANITKHIQVYLIKDSLLCASFLNSNCSQARSFLRKSVAAYKSGHYEHAIYILTQGCAQLQLAINTLWWNLFHFVCSTDVACRCGKLSRRKCEYSRWSILSPSVDSLKNRFLFGFLFVSYVCAAFKPCSLFFEHRKLLLLLIWHASFMDFIMNFYLDRQADYEKCVQDCNRSIALQKQCEEFPTSYLPWALPKDFQETECARLTLIRKGTGNAWWDISHIHNNFCHV